MTDMSWTGRRWAAVAAVAALVLLGASPAHASGGTWGVAQVPYSDGVVCHNGPVTMPLAAWDFGDGSPDFLLTEVSSNGVTDSAQLPQAGAPGRLVTPLKAGQYGLSDSDIATYAALLSRYGAHHGADTALAVLQRTDPAHVPDCGSTSDASGLLAQATAQAGPYRITVRTAHRPAILAAPNQVTVQVTGATGAPASGVRVELDASEPVFGTSTTTSVVTGSDGSASAAFTLPAGLPDPQLTFVASAQVAVGLEAVTVPPGFGQPYVPAVFADPPESYSGRTAVPIDQSADPHLTTTLADRAVVTQATVPLTAEVSGMHGHDGQAEITVEGPLPLDKHTLCAQVSATARTGTAYQSDLVDVRGDGAIRGAQWVPDKPGCYRLTTSITTTDATPETQARSRPVILTVLDTSGTIATSKQVVGTGAVPAVLHLQHAYGLSGTAAVRVRGPQRPGDADCTGLDWSHTRTVATATHDVSGDGSYPAQTGRLTAPGCYLLQGTVQLALPGGGEVAVPLQADADAGVVYVLQPTVALTGDATSAISPGAITAHVVVGGTYGQPGHLRVEMVHAPGGTFGCAAVDYAHGTSVAVGPSVPTSGDGTFVVKSGATPKNGCYTLVPTLVMDANPAIVAKGTPGAPGSTLVAGLNADGPPDAPVKAADGGALFGTSAWVAILVYVALSGAATLLVLHLMREKDEPRRPSPGLDQFLES